MHRKWPKFGNKAICKEKEDIMVRLMHLGQDSCVFAKRENCILAIYSYVSQKSKESGSKRTERSIKSQDWKVW